MMTQVSTESARVTLGNALKFFREQRRLNQRDLADRVGCSIGDIDNWEKGREAPPDHRWGRLCKVLHDDLAGMRSVWQRARAEEERERGALGATTLTTRPFAKLALVPTPAPAPAVVTPPVPVPETLHDDGFDLRPAYKAIEKLPEGWRTAEAVTARKNLARELILKGFKGEDIHKEVKRSLGVGIGPQVLTELRAEVRDEAARKHAATKPVPVPVVKEAPKMPEPVKPPEPAPVPVAQAKPENDIEGAVRLILEAIPNLASFSISVSADGDIDVKHTTREVKVVETSGSLKLRKP